MPKKFTDAFSNFGSKLLESIRKDHQERLDDAAFEERVIGIENSTSAMLELEIEEEHIIRMLQKYWDLRLSEARMFVDKQKDAF